MASLAKKADLPTSQVRRYLEPGPIVLVSSAHVGRTNIKTMGWHTLMEFTPSLVGCVISSANHSFEMIRQSRECVINLPTTKLTDVVTEGEVECPPGEYATARPINSIISPSIV